MAISSEVKTTSFETDVRQQLFVLASAKLQQAATMFTERVRSEYAGQTDHTLAELKAMGHPYGIPKAGVDRGPIPHEPYWMVHTRAGSIVNNLTQNFVASGPASFFVSVRAEGKVADWVISGTATRNPAHGMIARPMMHSALGAEAGTILAKTFLMGTRR